MKELKYMSNSKINKYKIFNFTYKICSLLFLFTIIIFLIIISSIFGKSILTLINDTDILVKNKIPNELIYLHNIVSDNGEKIKKIEKEISENLESLNQLLTYSNKFIISYNKNFNNPSFLNKIEEIIDNSDKFSQNNRLIQIANNLDIIAKALNKIAFNKSNKI